MWSHAGRLYVAKGVTTFKGFLKMLWQVPTDAPIGIHFRWSTGGKTNTTNCHPVKITRAAAVIHNGVLPVGAAKACTEYSDTVNFVRETLRPLYLLDGLGCVPTVEDVIGSYNKMVLLTAKGDCAIANEKAGTWRHGVWYSNGGGFSSCSSNGSGWSSSWDTYARRSGTSRTTV